MKEIKNLEIEKIVYGGDGLGRSDGKAVFVSFAVPGDIVDVEIDSETNSFIKAHISKLVQPSEFRKESECPYFQECGGCDFMHIAYDRQLFFKQQMLNEIFHKQTDKLNSIVPSPADHFYRNKIQLQYEGGALGFFQKKSHSIVPIDKCLIAQPQINAVIGKVRGLITPDIAAHLKYVIIKKSELTSELTIIFGIDADKVPAQFRTAANTLTRDKAAASVWINLLSRKKSGAPFAFLKLLSGRKYAEEEMLGVEFMLHPGSFVQVNIKQAENLYKKALELIEPQGSDRIIDAFCGPGVMSMLIGPQADKVLGIDSSVEAVKSAKLSMQSNNVRNAEVLYKKIENIDDSYLKNYTKILFDPPRQGLSKPLAARVNNAGFERIVYISCNPQTLKRDIERLSNYSLEGLYPFDMFPQTYHIETIALLVKR